MKKASIFFIISFILFSNYIVSAPSPTEYIVLQQPDGTKFTAEKFNDEFREYLRNNFCDMVFNEKDTNYYYGECDDEGKLIPTSYKVGKDEEKFKENLYGISYKNGKIFSEINNEIRGVSSINKTAKTATLPSLPTTLDVILVEFSDIQARTSPRRYTTAEFQNMLFSTNNYTHPDGYTTYGSLRKYYRDMSDGSFDITGSVRNAIDGNGNPIWVRLPNSKTYYDTNSYATFKNDVWTACASAGVSTSNSSSVKLAIIYAGKTWGAHISSPLHPAAFTQDNLYILPERQYDFLDQEDSRSFFTHIGFHVHEFGHLLGFNDYYLTASTSLEYWCAMGKGFDNDANSTYQLGSCPAPLNPYLRYIRGWYSNIQTVSSYLTNEQIVYNSNFKTTEVYKIPATNKSGTPNPIEYFLVENRQLGAGAGTNWNKYPDYTGGILIWYIKSSDDTIDLIEGDNDNSTNIAYDVFRYVSGSIYYKTKLNDYTTPDAKLFDDSVSNIVIRNISSSSSTMTADLSPFWGGTIDDSMTWSGLNVYVGENLTIPSGKTITLGVNSTSHCIIYIKQGKKIEVSGELISSAIQ